MDESKILKGLESAIARAKNIIGDPEKVKSIIARSKEKLPELRGPLEKVWEDIQLLIAMVKSYINGEYKEAPIGSIIAIIGGLIYLLSPIDAIPDFIPVAGLLDDVFVLNLVLKQVKSDLEKYKQWRNSTAVFQDDFPD